jgi:glutathione S-transferase
MLAARLKAQQARGSRYYVGETLTAADVYSASFIAMFGPLAHAQCPDPALRAAFETLDAETQAALDPILLEHRARMYAEHLTLPLAV